MIDMLSFLTIYMSLFFAVSLFGVSRFGHWGISKLLLGALQLILLYKIFHLDELNIANMLVLNKVDLNVSSLLIAIQITSFFLLPDTRQSFFKAILSCLMVLGIIISIASNSLLIFILAAQLATYSFLGAMAMDKGGKVSLNALRIFMKNEFYNGFFLLFILFFYLATGSMSLENIQIQSVNLFSLSGVMFISYFFSRFGIFPFHSNDTDIIRTTKLDMCSFGLILLKGGLLFASFKIYSVLQIHMNKLHMEYLVFIFRILGIATIIYAGLISTWAKNFFDSVSYLYVVLMGFLAFVFSIDNSIQIREISFVYIIISGAGLVLFLSHTSKYLNQNSEEIHYPAKPLPVIWALFTLGIMLGIPSFPGYEVKILIMKSLVLQKNIPDLLASCLTIIFGIQIIKFFKIGTSPLPNNYTVLKNTIGLQLYSAIVLLGLILFSINPTLLLDSLK
ncbi:MAG: hypothetical protein EP319_04345 [Deltaproteobacteria bacterium]|nr:MAG: hypothetical protein EP319_04345 [Deltaproteobacteria bacterium]